MMILLIAAVLVGLAIGILSGMLGVGGGTIMVPMFRLAFGMSALASTGTSLFAIIPTSISGVVSHVRDKTCVPKVGIAMGIGGASTSALGVWLASQSPGWAVMVAAAVVIGYSAYTMCSKALKLPKASETVPKRSFPESDAVKPGVPEEKGEQPDASDSPQRAAVEWGGSELTASLLVKAALIGVVAGVASGYVGLGGGFIMVPLMLAFLHMPMKLASGTSLIGIMLLAIPGAAMQCVLGNVDYLVAGAVVCGSVPGAFVGAKLAKRVSERNLRLMFAAFLGVGAVLLVVKEAGLLG